jgi:hypothetical protein
VALRVVVPAESGARPGSYRLYQGRVHRVEGSAMVDVHDRFIATQRGRITGLCAVRDCARTFLDAQLSGRNDGWLGHLRALLNGTYDRIIGKYGCLITHTNALAFRRDPDYPLLLSLEHYDKESNTAKKAALFTRRTLTLVDVAQMRVQIFAPQIHFLELVIEDIDAFGLQRLGHGIYIQVVFAAKVRVT